MYSATFHTPGNKEKLEKKMRSAQKWLNGKEQEDYTLKLHMSAELKPFSVLHIPASGPYLQDKMKFHISLFGALLMDAL